MNWWQEFWSADQSQVHTPQAVLTIIGTVLMLFCLVLLPYHCFYHGKGIDAETVKLILGLLGGGVLNAGASYFSKTTVSQVTKEIAPGDNKDIKPV